MKFKKKKPLLAQGDAGKDPSEEAGAIVETMEEPVGTPGDGKRDLREIMDYDRDFTIFFSGVESDTYFKGCYDMGVRGFLMSYHYLRNSKIPMKKRYEGYDVKFFIDSGAYTYQNDEKYRGHTVAEWEQHVVRYLQWAKRNREFIFAIANCDFELFVSASAVQEWNEKYFEPFMQETGIPVCFVWHVNSGRTWEQYCKRYPYVGFSSVSARDGDLGFDEIRERIMTAAKYNTLVHGMGMTQTPILPKLPYYTVDSTTWKSGFRYGQIALWNRNKIQLIRKEGFETKVFPIIQNYDIHPPLNLDKLRKYDEPEILRVNVYSYLRAEEYIRQMLKPLTYWKQAKAKTRKNLEGIEYPSPEWLKKAFDMPDWEKYAREFNISTASQKDALECITDMTILMNWDNPVYQEYRDKVYKPDTIRFIHDQFVNRIRNTDEERLQDIKDFYKANLMGEDTTLLYMGTNFDRSMKEREEYLDDTEYEYQDVDGMEMSNALSKYLPAPKEGNPAPEISDLDDEIFDLEGYVAIRDSNGKLVKGQRMVHRPKKVYSDKFPKLACDYCVSSQKCPEYKKGYVCAYNKIFDKYDTRDMTDIVQAMQGIVSFSLVRMQRAMIAETMNGGIPDPAVSQLMNQAMGYLGHLQKLYEVGSREVIKQTKVLRSDGTQEMTTQVTNPAGTGILERIFGGLGEPKGKEVVDEGA